VLYWFRLTRGADKRVDFVPYLVDNESGVGTQVVAADVNADGLPDIVVGNKRGTFVFVHGKRAASREE
jgi:FG-GAP repeat protein